MFILKWIQIVLSCQLLSSVFFTWFPISPYARSTRLKVYKGVLCTVELSSFILMRFPWGLAVTNHKACLVLCPHKNTDLHICLHLLQVLWYSLVQSQLATAVTVHLLSHETKCYVNCHSPFPFFFPQIYFMCSFEMCSTRDGPCVEGCFGQWR